MSSTGRINFIDILRAVSILGVMATHSFALYLGPPAINETWNYLHFVVVAFVFCSGYVTYYSYKHGERLLDVLLWYKKRFMRLYVPYITYVIAYILLVYALEGKISGHYILSSIFLTNGADVGWFTLLFLQLTVITPLLFKLMNNKKITFGLLAILLVISVVMTFYRIPNQYSRIVAWIPWSLIYLLGAIATRFKKYLPLLVGSLSVWWILFMMLSQTGAPLTLTIHKYPPDLFYFSYGLGITGILFWVILSLKGRIEMARPVAMFLSKQSYGLFFLQLIVLELLRVVLKGITVWAMLVASITLTVALVWLWKNLRSLFSGA